MHERPTVRQLEYLVALAETLNFRRAAEQCYVSQPALSAQIQKLEDLLGTRLFERDARRVLPTACGSAVAARAREVLARCDALLETAKSHDDPLAGSLRLGVIPTVAPYVLPTVLPAIREVRPDLKLLIREEKTDELLKGLDSGRLDCALLALEVDLNGMESLTLFEEGFALAVPASHPLAASREPIRQDELQGIEVLLLEDGHCLRSTTLEVCHGARCGRDRELPRFEPRHADADGGRWSRRDDPAGDGGAGGGQERRHRRAPVRRTGAGAAHRPGVAPGIAAGGRLPPAG